MWKEQRDADQNTLDNFDASEIVPIITDTLCIGVIYSEALRKEVDEQAKMLARKLKKEWCDFLMNRADEVARGDYDETYGY